MKPYSDSRLCKDIIWLCKGWYSAKKYPTLIDAFNAYYHKHYSECDDIKMSYALANRLFLYPTVMAFLNDENISMCFKEIVLEEASAERLNHITDFQEVLFERLSEWIMLQPVKVSNSEEDWNWIIDLSAYEGKDIL